MNRKICVVTGTRADYGLLRPVLEKIKGAHDLELQLVATGMHLSTEFGLTYREIEQDGFKIDEKIEVLLGADTPQAIAKAMGLGLIGFADLFPRLRPDLLLVLGDRFEILSAAAAALVHRIPVAHIHGGETTEGAFDESIRHALTKMAHLHFVAAAEYRQRVIQLGEDPARVFLVGGLGVDALQSQRLMSQSELEDCLGLKFGSRNLLITFHPATLEDDAENQLGELLAALAERLETTLIFTQSNADTHGRRLAEIVRNFARSRPNAHVYTSLGQLRYLSCLAVVDGVVGNSSSGLTEAPSLRKGTINIGARQRGRLKAESVIDSVADRNAISRSIDRLYSKQFQEQLLTVQNPYGTGGASEKIVQTIRTHRLDRILQKSFYDLPPRG